MPYVICKYNDGDRPMASINDSLLITDAEATERGFFELDRKHKIQHKFTWRKVYDSDSDLRPGYWVVIQSQEIGLDNDVIEITGLSFSGEAGLTMCNLQCTYWEIAGRDSPSGIDTIFRIADDGSYRVVDI